MENNLVDAVGKVDQAFLFIFGVSFAILFLITAVTLWFLFRYSKKRNPVPSDIEGNVIAETLWTVIPTLIVFAMFWYGWTGYKALREAPADSMIVKVDARMWSWKFTYDGGRTSDRLYVPENTPVKLDMTSADVIHSFYVPAFRIKMDTVPGMQTYAWFNSGEAAQYDILCAEYCGTRHAYMLSKVVVVPQEEYNKWLETGEADSEKPEALLILEKYGCMDCHSLDGSEIVGPSFKDIYGRDVTVTENGNERTVKTDDEYLKKAIKEPSAEIVKGYDDMMPPADEMSDEELTAVMEFFRGGMVMEKKGAAGAKVAENEGCLGCHSTDGSEIVGPSFKNMIDRKLMAAHEGSKVEVIADTRYIIDSIKNPDDYIVDGYDGGMMPAYDLSDDDMKALIEFFSTLKDE
ncbi:cytochrome c oxidase subunit II [Geovibrio thiophilus]|uniref:Cytochrome c oxidase subunit 2 n=1 Tax=Geovibrio thiophilus TaxID=139438 RepID=A0A410JX43_9BACT|nr:cytochrome c oxidase subunit II [Geovibrio thiophilus]QAR32595.1 cytochrome c oxidase subunit II [Geovibrio thiophilus]